MTVRHIYISDDGEEFDTEEECIEHEKMLDTSDKLLMFDGNCDILLDNDPGKNYELSFYLYILDADKANEFLNWIYHDYGYTVPDNVKSGDIYYYDDMCTKYINLNERINHLTELRNRILDTILYSKTRL